MEDILFWIFDWFLHIDQHIEELIQQFGTFTYLILFLIVFCETGLVVTPFLPGDSLLFAAGAMAALPNQDVLNAELVCLVLSLAAILGDTVNYWIGSYVGPKVFTKETSRWLNRKHLERTHQFYEKHGGKTIIIARFIPIIRTFAPFVAGIGKMTYSRFISFNMIGGVLWPLVFVYAGYFFGNIPTVKRNFSLVILMIIIISVMPAVVEFFRNRRMGQTK